MEVDETGFSQAEALEKTKPQEALKIYLDCIRKPEYDTDEQLKALETAIFKSGQIYVKLNDAKGLIQLASDATPLYPHFAKTKAAKIIRVLIDQISRVQGQNPTEELVKLCLDTIKGAEEDKRSFLKSRIETRLASIYVDMARYEQALSLIQGLVKQMKQIDDKLLLVEIHLIETRTCFNCNNLPKAKAALTSAKTNANAIHCPPLQQAEIDLWSGIIALREKDPRTAYSYLFEAYEGFRSNKLDTDEANSSHLSEDYTEKRTLQALRCQLLCVIIEGKPAQARSIAQGKTCIKYQDDDSIVTILKIARAYEDRSLKKLEEILKLHPVSDPIISHHLKDLYDSFLEKNLLKILEPFSKVELSHVAELIELDKRKTTIKLSQMILDGKLLGTVDEGRGNLILYPPTEHRETCKSILNTIRNASDCVDSLGVLVKKITAA